MKAIVRCANAGRACRGTAGTGRGTQASARSRHRAIVTATARVFHEAGRQEKLARSGNGLELIEDQAEHLRTAA